MVVYVINHLNPLFKEKRRQPSAKLDLSINGQEIKDRDILVDTQVK